MNKFFKIFLVLFIFLLYTDFLYANEEGSVILDTKEIKKLQVPSNYEITKSINYNGEKVLKEYYTSSTSLDYDEEVFESRTGKIFEKFVNDKAINNKFTNIPSKLAK